MIYGVGTDIINIERVAHILSKNKDGFVRRVLSEHEQALFANKGDSASYCAKRFAAKEAFAKALGTGIGKIVSFQDLSVRNNDEGKPYFIPSEKLRLFLLNKNIKHAHLSLSDEKYNAVAFVVLELGVENQNNLTESEYNTTF
ncbi:Holo-[acyl-carrier protein] synthase [hydrothermal vent metagenome]|jgi:holo-[acyl-carrier protein] synthase|uniref:Holo-[acyl-carrier protein] synthase n=1 Tax=hydrothermal vent metagenome TaxID=652676 RepID=A0A1W1DTM8_9ZZZZ